MISPMTDSYSTSTTAGERKSSVGATVRITNSTLGEHSGALKCSLKRSLDIFVQGVLYTGGLVSSDKRVILGFVPPVMPIFVWIAIGYLPWYQLKRSSAISIRKTESNREHQQRRNHHQTSETVQVVEESPSHFHLNIYLNIV